MAQRKVCIVTHTFLPHVGGIERVVYEQSLRLPHKGFEPSVLTSRLGTNRNYVYDGIKVQCYNSFNLAFRLGIPYPIPHLTSYTTFLRLIRSTGLVHVHGHPYISSLLASRIADKNSKPLVLTQHNTFIEYNNIMDTVERLNDSIIGREVIRRADKIIVVSLATKKYVLNLGASPKKVKVLHNGVDLKRFKPLTEKKWRMREKLGISRKASVSLTVRRLVYKNGIDTLIESARIAIKKNPKVIFFVIGKGPDFQEINGRVETLGIKQNFRLTGFVSDYDLPNYYNAADFFVLPSKSGEGLPLVTLEAMACGLPVIATNVGGIPEVVIGDVGKVVPADSPKALADAIVELSHRDLSSHKKELRRIVEERYSWDRNVTKLAEIYKEFI